MRVVRPLHPRFYQTLGKPAVDRTSEELATFSNLYFETDLGVIDLLGAVPPIGASAELARTAVTMTLADRPCRVISLDDLIEVKHHVGRAKDKLVEAELRAIRERLKAAP